MNFETSLIHCIKTNDAKGIEALGLTSDNIDDILISKIEIPNHDLLRGVLIPRYPTPLVYSILCRKFDVVKKLIDLGANQFLEVNGWKPIHYAVATSQLNIIKYMLESDESHLEVTTDVETTPLMLAVSVSSLDIVEYLLLSGADPNHQNKSGNTALHIATTRRIPNLVYALLSLGADPSITNNNGKVAADIAKERQNTTFLEALESQPEDFDIAKDFHILTSENGYKIEPAADSGEIALRIQTLDKKLSLIEEKMK